MMILTKEQQQAILRKSLYAFYVETLKTTMPGAEYLANWHILAMCAMLEEMIYGDLRRLIINIQPRMGKSLLNSIALPMFLLQMDPATQVMCLSYAESLASTFHQMSRLIAAQEWYRDLNPELKFKAAGSEALLKSTSDIIQTTKMGFRMARGFSGSITGIGGNWVIMDDPNDMNQISSETYRQNAKDAFDKTIASRLNDKHGRMLLVTQRGHSDDLTGHLMEKGGFKLLKIEAEATEDQKFDIGKGQAYFRKKGELLHPARFGAFEMAERKRDLGSLDFEAQYQQNPQPPDGVIFKKEWIRFESKLPEFQYVAITGDIATSLGKGDYTAFLVWGFHNGVWYLTAAHRAQLDQPGVIRLFKRLDQEYQPDIAGIESNGLGLGVIQHLWNEGYKYVKAVRADGSKVERAENATPVLESGGVYIFKDMPLREQFLEELMQFPSGKYDDMVDAFTLFIQWRHEIADAARTYRRPHRQHLPDHFAATLTLRITEIGGASGVRDNYAARTGMSVFGGSKR